MGSRYAGQNRGALHGSDQIRVLNNTPKAKFRPSIQPSSAVTTWLKRRTRSKLDPQHFGSPHLSIRIDNFHFCEDVLTRKKRMSVVQIAIDSATEFFMAVCGIMFGIGYKSIVEKYKMAATPGLRRGRSLWNRHCRKISGTLRNHTCCDWCDHVGINAWGSERCRNNRNHGKDRRDSLDQVHGVHESVDFRIGNRVNCHRAFG